MLWKPRDERGGATVLEKHGATVIATTTNTANQWTGWKTLATGAELANGADALNLMIRGSGSGVADSWLTEVGIDPAGGTSFAHAFYLNSSNSGDALTLGFGFFKRYMIPLRFPPGVSVGVRAASGRAAASNHTYTPSFFGPRLRGSSIIRSGSYADTIGTPDLVNTRGQSVPIGSSAWGDWTQLTASTARSYWWWQLGVGFYDATTTTSRETSYQLAFGDGTTFHVIGMWRYVAASTEWLMDFEWGNANPLVCYRYVPAGAAIYVRAYSSGAPDSNLHVLALGVGGG